MFVPTSMLKQLYTLGSLKETQNGLCFSLKSLIKSSHFNQVLRLSINVQRVDNN
ncbi:MAG: hydroxymethylglutaryl-CoA reductase (NADPH) [Paraglaciecola sp.]|jgi:hydroxymethylglutaryl-CoA reductase (NADPH)